MSYSDIIGRGLSLHVDCVVNEIEKRKQSHSNPKVDFSKKAKIYNTPCHLMYFAYSKNMGHRKEIRKKLWCYDKKYIVAFKENTYIWCIVPCSFCVYIDIRNNGNLMETKINTYTWVIIIVFFIALRNHT